MKKLVYSGLIFFLIAFLSSCANSYDFDADDLKSNVVKVDIIYLSEYQGSLYPDYEKEHELLVTLNDELKNLFIEDFSMLEFKKYHGSPSNSPKGNCLKFYYDDGSYAYITYYTFIRFSEDGSSYISTQNLHTSEDMFMDLVDKYINLTFIFRKFIIVRDNIDVRKDDYGIITIGLKHFLLNDDPFKL